MVVFLRVLILSSISPLGIGKPLAVCVVCAGCQGLFWWVFWGIPISGGMSLSPCQGVMHWGVITLVLGRFMALVFTCGAYECRVRCGGGLVAWV